MITAIFSTDKFISGDFRHEGDWEISHGAQVEPEEACEHCRSIPNPLDKKHKINVSRFIIASKDGKLAFCLHCILHAADELVITAKV